VSSSAAWHQFHMRSAEFDALVRRYCRARFGKQSAISQKQEAEG
jgi:hypothetical protein